MAGIFDQITSSEKNAELPSKHEADVEAGDEHTELASQVMPPSALTTETVRTEKRIREACQELLHVGFLEESSKPNLYRTGVASLEALNTALEPFDLAAGVDEIRGLIFLTVLKSETPDELDEWSHPLVRKQRLTLEQSLLIAILRQYFVAYEQDAGTGGSDAVVAIDELIPQLQVYLGDTGSEAKERKRAMQLLDQLKGHGLVTAPDAHDRIVIRPMIAHLANPENLQALLHWLRSRSNDGENFQADRESDA